MYGEQGSVIRRALDVNSPGIARALQVIFGVISEGETERGVLLNWVHYLYSVW